MEGEYAGVITFMKWCAEMIRKLDVNQFQNVHSCRSGLSDSCLRSLKRGIQGFFQLSVSGLLFYWSCSHVDEQLHMDL
ncbi:unnamed protein product [Prunus armeniaca]